MRARGVRADGGKIMGTFLDKLRLEDINGHTMRLIDDFRYVVSRKVGMVHVRAGFTTDFASIPRIFWALLPACGEHNRAAIAHDWLYARRRIEVTDGYTIPDRATCDWIFLCALKDCGISWAIRNIMWLAVRSPAGAWVWNHGEGAPLCDRKPMTGKPWRSRKERANDRSGDNCSGQGCL